MVNKLAESIKSICLFVHLFLSRTVWILYEGCCYLGRLTVLCCSFRIGAFRCHISLTWICAFINFPVFSLVYIQLHSLKFFLKILSKIFVPISEFFVLLRAFWWFADSSSQRVFGFFDSFQIFGMEVYAGIKAITDLDCIEPTKFIDLTEDALSMTSVGDPIVNHQPHDRLKSMVSACNIKISSYILRKCSIRLTASPFDSFSKWHPIGWLMSKNVIVLHVHSVVHGCEVETFV